MGARELIWGLIAVLAVYVLWQLYRARRAPNAVPRAGAADVPAKGEAAAKVSPTAAASEADAEDDGDFEAYAPTPRPAAPAARATAASTPSEAFQLEFELQQLRREVAQLRTEQQAQRQEMAALVDGLRALREQFDVSQASQSVSPEYDEALVFARRGLDAEAIAERCGISVAEAQLVLSLARGGSGGGREVK